MFLSLGSDKEVALKSSCHHSAVLWSANIVWEVTLGHLWQKLVKSSLVFPVFILFHLVTSKASLDDTRTIVYHNWLVNYHVIRLHL